MATAALKKAGAAAMTHITHGHRRACKAPQADCQLN